MAETLTISDTPAETPELTEEEQNSLEIGEQMQSDQEQLLAGKYKSAEELEKAYKELESKLGEQGKDIDTEPEPTESETKEDTETAFLDSLWQESQAEGDFKEETINKLNEMSQQDLAQEYLNYRASQTTELTQEDVTTIKNIAGGEKGYSDMIQWATNNLQKQDIEMFDAVMDKGDPLSAFFAVQAMNYRYNDAMGVDGQMLTGKAARNKADSFQSQQQLVEAMSDPRYDKDPAYRKNVIEKLERSEQLNF